MTEVAERKTLNILVYTRLDINEHDPQIDEQVWICDKIEPKQDAFFPYIAACINIAVDILLLESTKEQMAKAAVMVDHKIKDEKDFVKFLDYLPEGRTWVKDSFLSRVQQNFTTVYIDGKIDTLGLTSRKKYRESDYGANASIHVVKYLVDDIMEAVEKRDLDSLQRSMVSLILVLVHETGGHELVFARSRGTAGSPTSLIPSTMYEVVGPESGRCVEKAIFGGMISIHYNKGSRVPNPEIRKEYEDATGAKKEEVIALTMQEIQGILGRGKLLTGSDGSDAGISNTMR